MSTTLMLPALTVSLPKCGQGFTLKTRILTLLVLLFFCTLTIIAFNTQILGSIGIAAQAQTTAVASQREQIATQAQLVAEQTVLNEQVEEVSALITRLYEIQFIDFFAGLTFEIERVEVANALKDSFATDLQALAERDPQQAARVAVALKELATYRLAASRMFTFYESNNPSMGRAMAMASQEQAGLVVAQLRSVIADYQALAAEGRLGVTVAGNVVAESGGELLRGTEQISARVAEARRVSVISVLLYIVLGAIAGLLVLRSVLRPIRRLGERIAAMEAANDVSGRIAYERRDELSVISHAFDGLMNKFDHIIRHIAASITDLSAVAKDSQQASATVQTQVDRQADQLDQVAAASNEMALTAQQIEQHSRRAVQAAEAVNNAAQHGAHEMQAGMALIETLNTHIAGAEQVIRQLAGRSDAIGSVLDVIRGVSEQTNLLALNAAIEAARAGEQGRGFAVVADEVRNLAQRTSESAGEIQRMVEALQADAKSAVSAMVESGGLAHNTVEQIRVTHSALNNIETQMVAIRDVNAEIAQATSEQSNVARAIDQSLETIRHAADEVNGHVRTLTTANSALSDVTEHLRGLIAQFDS